MRRSAAALPLAALLLAAACRTTLPPPPQPARTPERALAEVPVEELPAFADDLDFAGLEEAIARSAAWLARIAAADPGRTFAFGKERVPIARVQATLARFRELALARPAPPALGEAIRREFRVFRSIGDGRGTVLFTG
jgi:membrane-bound lytic murein transglycosylase A